MPELTEVEIQRLQTQDRTLHSLMGNPKAKKKILEAYKAANPEASIPELELEEAAKAPVMALEKDIAELKKQLADEKAENEKNTKLAQLSGSIEAGITKLRQAGWLDENIAELRKTMEERGILDVDIAAAYYEKQHPPQEVATPRGVGGWNFIDNVQDNEADLKKLLETKGNSEVLADKMARDALNEFRGAQRR